MTEYIMVTPTEKRILECIDEALKNNKNISIPEISKKLGLNIHTIYLALSKYEGLYYKIPELRLLIGRRPKIEYDISKIKEAAMERQINKERG